MRFACALVALPNHINNWPVGILPYGDLPIKCKGKMKAATNECSWNKWDYQQANDPNTMNYSISIHGRLFVLALTWDLWAIYQ